MGRGRQNWRAFRPVMHLHENHYTKRAGVAGIRARAECIETKKFYSSLFKIFLDCDNKK